MSSVLDVAKVTSKGQMTIPASVREAIGIKAGDKVMFIQQDGGNVSICSSNLKALSLAQAAFSGAAEEAALNNAEELTSLVKSIRADRAKAVKGSK